MAKLISNYFFLFTLGCLVTPNNVEEVIKSIVYRLDELEKRSFEVSADVNNVMSNMRAEAERLTYGLFEEETSVSRSVSMLPSVATSTADSGFIAMIRTGKISRHKINKLPFQLLAVFSQFSALESKSFLKVLLYHFHQNLIWLYVICKYMRIFFESSSNINFFQTFSKKLKRNPIFFNIFSKNKNKINIFITFFNIFSNSYVIIFSYFYFFEHRTYI